MSKRLLLYFLFFLSSSQLFSSSFSFSNSTQLCPHHQTLALLHLKQSFSVNNSSSLDCHYYGVTSYPKTESWKKGSDCCSWDGVTCDWVTGHVIELDLSCSWLFGTIHSNTTLFLFLHLQRLNLAFNNFSGSSVSAGFGRFSSLTHLNLSDSGFSGPISSEISHLSNLVSLDLSWNSDAEFAPHGFNSLVQNLTKLHKLHLGGISISSVFPDSLLNRSSLISLDLSSCGLHGRFPDHDIHLPKLEVLNLEGNDDLSGNFPRFSENNSLKELYLSSTNFSGELPASIGNLKSLQTLYIFNCEFSGSIPASLENLTQITSLNLNRNLFSGKIPNVFSNLRNLISLRLHGNNFSGQLPSSIGNLTNLQVLDLYDNQLEGVIPSFVNGFLSLSYVALGYNLLNGTIPSWLYTLPSLVGLYLNHNKLTGHIGEFQFDSLESIDLSMNELHGSIPSSIFKLVNLRYLYLSSNNFSSVLETSNFGKLRNLTSLDLSNNMLSLTTSGNSKSMLPYIERLDLSNNKISGVWSWNIGKDTLGYLNLSCNLISGFEMLPWKNIGILDLHSNLLQGPLPTPPNSTFFFSVSHNKLSGEISLLICKVSSMGVLDLSNNNLSGVLPHCLGNFSKDLSVLNLRRNRFHGIIPQTFLKGNAIRNLDFNDNQLEGLVPRSLIICQKLEVLDLGNNEINDTFPHWLGTLPKLQVLVLRSNSFHGHIRRSKIKSPFMSLRIIDLAHNDFEGDLPEMYLRSLKATMNIDERNMTRKYMGDSYYQDSVMVTIKGLEIEFVKILNTFTTIDLSSNKFQGEIPKSIGNLNSLRGLNLSHNNLAGHIPSSFGNLKLLESLDLSSNKLSGRIPQELTSLTFLEVLNLSQNNLIGFIPRGNQLETFENDSYNGNSGLCGFPLSKKCTTDETLEPSKKMDAKFESGFD
ncbi:receptor-like protein 6 [Vitis riparia]|uniref:receptor-like protein 6 n=1 Tax=Vitis riparia TaxID=96939 RepID=UPI00155A5C51|nr:receptor-like protein 6 [Vitis riparia]